MTTLTRDELYALVWSEPIRKIAPRYGLSDRGFGQLCARHRVPVSPRGWWAKKAAGHRVRETPLLPLSDPYRQKIRLENKAREVAADVERPEVHPLVAFEQDAVNQISVPTEGELSHPLLLKTQRLLKRSKREADGRIAVPAVGLEVHTSRELHERTLRIMQALLVAFEARGFLVTTTADGIRVTILDEPLGFGIVEETKKVEHRVSFTEQNRGSLDSRISHGGSRQRESSEQPEAADESPRKTCNVAVASFDSSGVAWSSGGMRPVRSPAE